MGVVYDGYDPTLNRRVAVKTILKNHYLDPATAQDFSKRFVREAQAAGRLNHANIVQVHDFGEDDDVAYLVMEYIEGRELKSFLESGERFGLDEAVRIMCELLDALDFAHEAGVIHRDIKPANVILDAQRRVKLADFGVARIEDSSERSQAGSMVGTPAYMSPEQVTGSPVDRRTDLFSAGVILYELLTAKRPFTGSGAWTIARMIVQDDPPPPSTLVLSVSSAFDAVVQEALAKKPENRFARAGIFAVALRRAQAAAQAGSGASLPGSAGSTFPPSAPLVAAPERAALQENQKIEMELEFWRSIKDSKDTQELELFLKKFPDGTYAELAQLKMEKLRNAALAGARELGIDEARKEPTFLPDSAPIEPALPTLEPPAAAKSRNSTVVATLSVVLAAAIGGGIWITMFAGKAEKEAAESKPVAQKDAVADAKEFERKAAEKAAAEQKAEAEKLAAEQRAVAEKAAQDAVIAEAHAAQEKAAQAKKTTEKVQAEKSAAEKAARTAEKMAKESAASEIARLEALRAERLAAERAVAEKAEAERVAAEKAAADRAAAEKAAESAKQAARAAAAARQGRPPPCPAPAPGVTWTNCVGETTLASGVRYAGEFRDGTYNGQGSMTFPNGSRYVGAFRNGTYNGQGDFTLPSGERYVGEFRDGKFNGQATYTFPNGERYVGEFRDGVYSGRGTYTVASGAKWIGPWRDGKRNGQGIEYRPDGTVLRTGIWENGTFIRGP